ncbi:phage gene 29 protein family protein [Hoyosella altamirensis]|uniref:Uncharacterized protein n=1 Tax=Hoyosella altamirensis TaxID=616997 RepID=A0A839RV75_9ACTN|nr:hypothetical protein [Hoyosella altamirensis]MBB3040156.1 hypothetical protein [Hoyosella altamirensis]
MTTQTPTDVEAAAAELEQVIGRFGFYDKQNQNMRIEFDMPLPRPIARHLAERGVRIHPGLAVVKRSTGQRGEETWVPLDAPDPEPEPADTERLDELEAIVAQLQDRIDAARKAQDEP